MSNLRRHSFEPASLSRAGVERRERVLDELHAQLDRRVARRRATRTVSGVLMAVVIVSVGVVWAALPNSSGSVRGVPAQPVAISETQGNPVPPPVPPSPVAPPESRSAITIVATDPSIVRRLSVAPARSTIEIISDTALQHELTSAGVDPGLVTINGRTLVTLAAREPRESWGDPADNVDRDEPNASEPR